VGLDPEVVYSFAFHVFVGGIAGARLFYVIEYWEQFQAPTLWATIGAIANVTQGGLVVYGSLIGGAATGLWYLRRHKLPILAMADLVTPGMMLGLALGRIGCLLNGCCHGGICEDGMFGIQFPPGSPPYVHQSQLGLFHGFRIAPAGEGRRVIVEHIEPDGPAAAANLLAGAEIRSINGVPIDSFATARAVLERMPGELFVETDLGTAHIHLPRLPQHSYPVHPTQIYSSINAALLCLLLWAFYPLRRRDGEVFALLLSLYPVTRFLLEIVRADEPGQLGTPLTISQIVSLALLGLAILLWGYLLRRPRGTAFPVASG
jgi:phosphatidylglycerol:prolipoprotein diacylglycerol transferase